LVWIDLEAKKAREGISIGINRHLQEHRRKEQTADGKHKAHIKYSKRTGWEIMYYGIGGAMPMVDDRRDLKPCTRNG
jgi:hypothetical protein